MRIKIKDKVNFMNLYNDIYPNHTIDKINGITIDSRKIMKNDIFFPIKGKNYDGHDYIKLIKHDSSITYFSENENYKDAIICNSIIKEIINIASLWREKTNSKIIAITGSNGKTTIKELLYHILKKKYKCSKSEGNYNSKIGLPLTFLSSLKNDDYCILELGANSPYEIKYLAKIVKPNYAVITNISKAHIGNFRSFEELIKTKNEIFDYVQNNGQIFINNDDENIHVPNNKKISTITYSFNNSSDLKAKYYNSILEIKNNNKNKKIYFSIPNELSHLINIILSAYAISKKIGIKNSEFQDALNSFKIPDGRGQIVIYKNCKIIDDSYNANPSSMMMGINRLSDLDSSQRKIAVLGDMLELGQDEISEHKKIGELLNSQKIEIILVYGKLMEKTYNVLDKKTKEVFYFKNFSALHKKFNSIIKNNDIIYIKGSRSMKLERLYK